LSHASTSWQASLGITAWWYGLAHLPVYENFEALMVFPADSSRKGLRRPFNLLLPLHYTHRAIRRTRNVSGIVMRLSDLSIFQLTGH
jgi:hypothetical protein